MKFKALEDIRYDGRVLEEGNTFDSVKQGIPDNVVRSLHDAGVAQIDGEEPKPRSTSPVTVKPNPTTMQVN